MVQPTPSSRLHWLNKIKISMYKFLLQNISDGGPTNDTNMTMKRLSPKFPDLTLRILKLESSGFLYSNQYAALYKHQYQKFEFRLKNVGNVQKVKISFCLKNLGKK